MYSGSIGTVVFSPCIYISLLEADRRNIILIKGEMKSPVDETLFENIEILSEGSFAVV
jgi:hypothetical protein